MSPELAAGFPIRVNNGNRGARAILPVMGEPARKLEQPTFLEPKTAAGKARLAAILALPLSDEPLTPEEEAGLEEADRARASGGRGSTTEDILAIIEERSHELDG